MLPMWRRCCPRCCKTKADSSSQSTKKSVWKLSVMVLNVQYIFLSVARFAPCCMYVHKYCTITASTYAVSMSRFIWPQCIGHNIIYMHIRHTYVHTCICTQVLATLYLRMCYKVLNQRHIHTYVVSDMVQFSDQYRTTCTKYMMCSHVLKLQ